MQYRFGRLSPRPFRSLSALLFVFAAWLLVAWPRLGWAASDAVLASAAPAGVARSSRAQELAPQAYAEQEYFFQGQAQAYKAAGPWGRDGRWSVAPAGAPQAYTTRILVRRPQDPAKFNGVVVVEWLNTTFGLDFDAIWALAHREFVREGYAWVGVTAEPAGVAGLNEPKSPRYVQVNIPEVDLSYDIFTQVGQFVRGRGAAQLLGGAPVRTLLATGYSQSAVFLHTYINAIQPVQRTYDGFLMQGRAPFAAPLSGLVFFTFNPAIRTDLAVPVFLLQTESEVIVSWPLSKTPDTDKLRHWEVAGAAHVDRSLSEALAPVAVRDYGTDPIVCKHPLNDMPLYEVQNAAWHALRTWVTEGKAPPIAPRMARGRMGFIQDDDDGNALGGLRLPEIEAPLGHYGTFMGNGSANSWGVANMFSCAAGGRMRAFDAAALRKRYPNRQAYLDRYKAAADAALAAGFLLPVDHQLSLQRAQAAAQVLAP